MATKQASQQASPYSIRVVASQTGIPIDTLRMWERRYGFPKPARRAGGGRLYNSDDVTRLRLIARARDAGYRPGDLIALSDRDIAKLVQGSITDEAPLDALALGGATVVAASSANTAASSAVHAVDALLNSIKREDVSTIRQSLRVLATTLGPKAFVTDIAHPLAVRIGDAWERGTLEVRHEHLASALLSMQLRLLLHAFESSETVHAVHTPVVVLSTLPGEAHNLPLEMVALYLAVHGATPRLLGPDTPPEQIARAAESMNADVVGISISSTGDNASQLTSTRKHVDQLRRALHRKIELWVGGAGATSTVDASRASRGLRITTSWSHIDEALRRQRLKGG